MFNAPSGGVVSPDVTGLGGTWTTGQKVITGLSSTANLAVGMRVSGTGIVGGQTIASINGATQVTLNANTTSAGSGDANFGYAARTLTLTGTSTSANTIAGVLQDSSATGAYALGITKAGTGTWVLPGANTYSGNTTVNAGTLKITGSVNNSAVTVNNGGVLAGDGSVKSLTVASDGTVAPGASVDILSIGAGGSATMSAGGIYEWEFNGASGDLVSIAGDLTLNDNWMIKLIDAGGTPQASQQYDLFTYTGSYTGDDGFSAALANIVIDNTTSWDIAGLSIVKVDPVGVTPGRVYITGIGTSVVFGDTNSDNVVDAADFITLKKNFGTTSGAGVGQGNFTGADGAVNWADLNILTNNMGAAPHGPAMTPEPCSAILLVFGAAAIIRRRKAA